MPEPDKLDFIEYAVFCVTLAISAFIGIFYGCVKTTGQNTVTGYMFGGKQMPVLPVALSLISSYISGITLIGIPSEMYYFSTQYLVVIIPTTFAFFILVYVALPIFFKLQLVSIFEYMELRFGQSVREVTSLLYCLSSLTHSAIVIYGPAIALNQVTGINVQTISIVVAAVCIFYTTLGGVKAVVWADSLQMVIMVFSMLAVLGIGVQRSGGNTAVMSTALEGGRIDFFNFDPSARISFWSQSLGMVASSVATIAFSPPVMQRLLCLPSIKKAIVSSWLMSAGTMFFPLVSGYLGLAMYAFYKKCDPFAAKIISHPDQIVPNYVMDISRDFKGLCGLFLAGIVSAALSSLSTNINTLAGTTYEDFIEPRFKAKPSEKRASLIIKVLAVVIGIFCLALTNLVARLGYMLELSSGLSGISTGATLGLFLLGIFHPRATNKGAAIGGLVSLVVMTIIMTGNALSKTSGAITTVQNVMNVDDCPFNVTLPLVNRNEKPDGVFPLFKIPVFFYSAIGSIIVVVVGSLASLFTGSEGMPVVNRDCLSPWIHRFLEVPREKNMDHTLSTDEIFNLTQRKNGWVKDTILEKEN